MQSSRFRTLGPRALVGLLLATLLVVSGVASAHASYADELGEPQEVSEGVGVSDESTDSVTDVDEQDAVPDDSVDADGDSSAEAISDEDAPLESDSTSEEPPNPTHMWSPENMPQRRKRELLASVAPYWATQNGQKSFYDGYGSLYASPAIRVIDVSEWQGSNIYWDSVAADGVDAAILRIGWGDGAEDKYFSRNLSEVRRIGMPYGVYLYSYAYDADFARGEANSTADLLDKYGCKDLSLPIYYDIEKFDTWSGHSAPSDPGSYEQIIRTYIDTMAVRGYTNVHVYTYRSYLQNELNSTYIRQRTSWIAEYGPRLNITNSDYSGQYGWQYTSTDYVNGISGPVDMSAFSGFSSTGSLNVAGLPLAEVPDGKYYIDSLLKPSSSIDMMWGSTESGARIQLYSYNKSDAQQYELVAQGDGSYVIQNVNSGLVLDVQNGAAFNGAIVQQYVSNGSDAQRWFIRESGYGYYIQSALGNWVLDVNGASTADGASITLYAPNGSDAQKYMLASTNTDLITTDTTVKVSSAANSGLVFDIENASKDNNARLQVYESNGTDAQVFVFSEMGNGLYTISSAPSGKAIEVSAGQTDNGSPVAQYDVNGTIAQWWAIRDYGTDAFALVNAKSGKAIDVPSGSMVSGNKLQIYTSNGTAAQLWRMEKATTSRERLDQLAAANSDVLAEGTYVIGSSKSPSQVLDVQWASLSSGANVWIYASNSTSAQRWSVSKDDGGYVTLTNELTGKVLDVANGAASNYANVQQWDSNGSWAQKWIPIKNNDGSITLISALSEGYALDLNAGETVNTTNVQLYAKNDSAAQKFVFTAAPMVIEDGVYTIASSLNRSMALEVQWGSMEDGANVWLYESNGTDAQKWNVTNEPGGALKIINLASGKSLDLMWGGTTSGTNVWQYASNDTAAQRWQALQNADGSITLRSALAPSLVLDVSNGVASSQANIQVYEQNSTAAQNFVFERVG